MKNLCRFMLAVMLVKEIAPTVYAATTYGAGQVLQSGTWNLTNITGTVSLPTGASTAAKQPALGTAGTPSTDVITVQGATSMTAVKVDGSAVTQPISGSLSNITGTVSLPTGASTSAKQPALGTAGTPSADVISVQGVSNGTSVMVTQASSASPANTRVTVTTADTQILAANANRKGLECQSLITNTDRIFRKWNAAAATTSDYPMEPGADWTPPMISTAALRGISNTGSQVIVCTEY